MFVQKLAPYLVVWTVKLVAEDETLDSIDYVEYTRKCSYIYTNLRFKDAKPVLQEARDRMQCFQLHFRAPGIVHEVSIRVHFKDGSTGKGGCTLRF